MIAANQMDIAASAFTFSGSSRSRGSLNTARWESVQASPVTGNSKARLAALVALMHQGQPQQRRLRKATARFVCLKPNES